jgi:hypothetical protein
MGDCCIPLQRKSPSRVHREEGTPPPNEILQLRRGARQYRARGRGEYFDTMGFFVA